LLLVTGRVQTSKGVQLRTFIESNHDSLQQLVASTADGRCRPSVETLCAAYKATERHMSK
jgi:hypothetical protein